MDARRFPRWIRRHRARFVFSLAMVAALAVILTMQLSPRADSTELSIRNPAPNGAKAAAEILGRHGVTVEQSESFEQTLASIAATRREGSGSTVLLYDQRGFLQPERLPQLLAATDRLVVVSPRLATLSGLGATVRQAGVVPEPATTLEPGCSVADAEAAGAVSADQGFLYTGGSVCYGVAGNVRGLYSSAENGKLVVLGSTAIINNRLLDENGNAALTLRTLGSQSHLVWYLPGVADLGTAASPKTLDDLAPDWAAVLGPWLTFVALLAVFWRGRRLGPLVFEPLPVTVKAAETAEGRARLYHDAHAVDRAADNLRAGTLVRLAGSLRLGAGVESADVASAAARHLDRDPADTYRILHRRPQTEAQLVSWAQELAVLEKEVTTT
ncbi:hypothetical protein ASG92_08525 [Arthrobacter sp. Soil736]|nr:hypothetical protein ASG92_08525 [Arthrobacter sp. Soil736]